MNSETFFLILAIIGSALCLIAFFLNQTEKMDNDDIRYDLLNGFGALLLVLYSIDVESVPFIVLNGVWSFVGLKDVAIILWKRRNLKK